jgi:hypothetical protein
MNDDAHCGGMWECFGDDPETQDLVHVVLRNV